MKKKRIIRLIVNIFKEILALVLIIIYIPVFMLAFAIGYMSENIFLYIALTYPMVALGVGVEKIVEWLTRE